MADVLTVDARGVYCAGGSGAAKLIADDGTSALHSIDADDDIDDEVVTPSE
jgi:hypothetical protein